MGSAGATAGRVVVVLLHVKHHESHQDQQSLPETRIQLEALASTIKSQTRARGGSTPSQETARELNELLEPTVVRPLLADVNPHAPAAAAATAAHTTMSQRQKDLRYTRELSGLEVLEPTVFHPLLASINPHAPAAAAAAAAAAAHTTKSQRQKALRFIEGHTSTDVNNSSQNSSLRVAEPGSVKTAVAGTKTGTNLQNTTAATNTATKGGMDDFQDDFQDGQDDGPCTEANCKRIIALQKEVTWLKAKLESKNRKAAGSGSGSAPCPCKTLGFRECESSPCRHSCEWNDQGRCLHATTQTNSTDGTYAPILDPRIGVLQSEVSTLLADLKEKRKLWRQFRLAKAAVHTAEEAEVAAVAAAANASQAAADEAAKVSRTAEAASMTKEEEANEISTLHEDLDAKYAANLAVARAKEAIRSAMEAESTAHTAEAKPAKAVAAAAMKVATGAAEMAKNPEAASIIGVLRKDEPQLVRPGSSRRLLRIMFHGGGTGDV